ncbi:uncharacterized protein DEA37_0006181 [Paragonimus westermani]|uniref:Antistasin-like domain-containing protein n=1 Tax=Paragonimus westermani TaxID=34504 RepID=A0A5J4P334_9TREM|nr:uncharacterized protein DEA37_0006181 [Paragonimus westermani]
MLTKWFLSTVLLFSLFFLVEGRQWNSLDFDKPDELSHQRQRYNEEPRSISRSRWNKPPPRTSDFRRHRLPAYDRLRPSVQRPFDDRGPQSAYNRREPHIPREAGPHSEHMTSFYDRKPVRVHDFRSPSQTKQFALPFKRPNNPPVIDEKPEPGWSSKRAADQEEQERNRELHQNPNELIQKQAHREVIKRIGDAIVRSIEKSHHPEGAKKTEVRLKHDDLGTVPEKLLPKEPTQTVKNVHQKGTLLTAREEEEGKDLPNKEHNQFAPWSENKPHETRDHTKFGDELWNEKSVDRKQINDVHKKPPHPQPLTGSLVEDMEKEHHSVYMEHLSNEEPVIPANKPPAEKSEHEEQGVAFVAGRFGSKLDSSKSKPVVHSVSGVQDSSNGQILSTLAKQEGQEGKGSNPSKTWMNFHLMVDDSGSLNIQMAPSQGSNKINAASFNPNSAMRLKRREGVPDAWDVHEKFMNRHNGPTSNFNPGTSEWDPASQHEFENGNRLRENLHTQRFPQRRRRGSTDFEGHSLSPPGLRIPHSPELHQPWPSRSRSPQLLFGRLSEFSGVDQNRPKHPASLSSAEEKTTILESIPIQMNIDIDNPSTNGCAAKKCAKPCHGDLWKLSPATGCPTCECCPTVSCKLTCKFGYKADLYGCPTCKCLTQ